MATLIVINVGSGQDEPDPNTAWANSSAYTGGTDWVSLDVEVEFRLHDALYTTRSSFTGVTTDSTHTAKFVNVSGGDVVLQPTTGGGHTITVLNDFVSLGAGIRVLQYAGANISDECLRIGSGSESCLGFEVNQCDLEVVSGTAQQDCVYMGNWDVGSASFPVKFLDCYIFNATRGGFHLQSFGTETHQYVDIINCSNRGSSEYGVAYRINDAASTLNIRYINNINVNHTISSWGTTGTTNGTLITTGSVGNFDEDGLSPGQGTPNPITVTDDPTPGAGDWCIFVGADILVAYDMHLQDVVANDVLLKGDGPTANALVSSAGRDGNPRSGSTCDPGCYEVLRVSGDLELTLGAAYRPVRSLVASLAKQSALALSTAKATRPNRDLASTLSSQLPLDLTLAGASRPVRDLSVTLVPVSDQIISLQPASRPVRDLTLSLDSQVASDLTLQPASRPNRSIQVNLSTQPDESLLLSKPSRPARDLVITLFSGVIDTITLAPASRPKRDLTASLSNQPAIDLDLSAPVRPDRDLSVGLGKQPATDLDLVAPSRPSRDLSITIETEILTVYLVAPSRPFRSLTVSILKQSAGSISTSAPSRPVRDLFASIVPQLPLSILTSRPTRPARDLVIDLDFPPSVIDSRLTLSSLPPPVVSLSATSVPVIVLRSLL